MAMNRMLFESIRLAESQVLNAEVTNANTTMADEAIGSLLMD